MAHAFDRTLVQQLGLDPDHKSSAHDDSCLRCQQHMGMIVDIVVRHIFADGKRYQLQDVETGETHLEVPVMKGDGKYQSHIGFIDLVSTPIVVARRTDCGNWTKSSAMAEKFHHSFPIGIEVKTTPVPIGEVLRQIKLYREYSDCEAWVYAVEFQQRMHTRHVAAITNEDIFVVEMMATDVFVSCPGGRIYVNRPPPSVVA